MTSNKILWQEIGQYIVNIDERNIDGIYTIDDVRGLSIDKKFIPTKANMDGVSLKPYKIVRPGSFCYVTVTSRNSEKLTLAYNDSEDTYLVSSSYEVFRVSDIDSLSPEFLFLWFVRPEFNRYSRFHSWGSARETFSFEEMKRVQIPIPSIEKQLAVVDAWKSLRRIKEENEALATPLIQLSSSLLQDLKRRYKSQPIFPFVQKRDERNKDLSCHNVKGLTVYKQFIETKADMNGVPLHNYKVVYPNDIAYVSTTNRNGDRIACGLCDEKCIVSSIYDVFYVADTDNLDPTYLFMWFKRSEMDRYARYNSWGSARETITWEDLTSYKIPIPPIEEQKAIVSLYNCALEYQRIAANADTESRRICPSLLQYVINN